MALRSGIIVRRPLHLFISDTLYVLILHNVMLLINSSTPPSIMPSKCTPNVDSPSVVGSLFFIHSFTLNYGMYCESPHSLKSNYFLCKVWAPPLLTNAYSLHFLLIHYLDLGRLVVLGCWIPSLNNKLSNGIGCALYFFIV
ncbi:hypothetical protein HMPREF1544_08403 [Mucor circinelloides 1006PhL]|uniref:Uncharacterized protein n=1 Tax=Mucor circinelloides f. circinelloides (strain 1006PhL) TaxID=1220926 RepID=S2JQF2_MUCC1|nr:hypothetical protein HMPREF1544_08403 [Mucor circinelloides 1006PhL]